MLSFLKINKFCGMKGQEAHIYVYVRPRTQFKEELLLGHAWPWIKGMVCH